MNWLRKLIWVVGLLVIAVLAMAAHYYYKAFYRPAHVTASRLFHPVLESNQLARIHQKAAAQRDFLRQGGFNTSLCFLVDMQVMSGKDRFYVYDLSKDSVVLAGLVAHGCGSSKFSFTPTFSNVDGSSCTSLGRYRIGYPYMGTFGRAYKLYGLDATNDQAFARSVVLHSYSAVPAAETAPYPICNSRGCPMVSKAFMDKLQPMIDASKKPIMLYIFY